ncbi:conserved hypothetical protein [Microsporum canis CBS 113480]|uniref:Uncharacterized protein n=1 Tax=Arthroderma otae (strain ATCC MYA-4605 / CBS 113480) TaxID=554155 RepID=C5FTP0_ARTOC|nr:conserved hypothetical protein [Microsporum canis CBS 113480]EEQ33243.1 conserved hypothetical protein [Microsporum canis CBS 113480]
MASETGIIDVPTMAERVQKIRSRLSALFSGASSVGSCSIDNPQKLQFPPAGARIFAPRPGGNVHGERNIPPGRRSISSTGSVIDRTASPNNNIPPFPYSETVDRISHPGPQQRGGGQVNKGVFYINWIRRTKHNNLDLVLAVTSSGKKFEFHVILIIAMMACTIFFCHSLIRLLMTAKRRPVRRNQPIRAPCMVERLSQIDRPIPVFFASDLEMGLGTGADHDESKPGPVSIPPPAYGFWSGSVKMDPNRLYWQSVNPHDLIHQHSQSMNEVHPSTANRPPSYISEHEVQYVVNSLLQPQPIHDPAAALVHPAERDTVKP